MPDRRSNADIRDRLEAIQVGYERWAKYTIRLLVILFLVQLALGLLAVYLVGQNQRRSDEIQESRKASIRLTCKEQNDRHDKTIATLNKVVEQTRKLPGTTAAERKDLDRSVGSTILFIDALAPKQDCEKRVRVLTANPPPR